jgi:fluoroquinolone transport system permease protein
MKLRTLRYDYKLLKGDPMLILSMGVPFILWALMQFLVPWIVEKSMEQWGIDLSPYYHQAGTFFLMLVPMMMGMVYGFILLDERDGGIITAISVTPTGKSGYLKLRMGIPMAISFIFVLLFVLLLDLSEYRNLIQLVLIALVFSSQSLILLLFLGAFADNKVMGLAISKGFGILLLGPMLDYILPSPFFWIGSYSPMFWASRAFLTPGLSLFWLYTSITILFHALLLWILFRKFRARSD